MKGIANAIQGSRNKGDYHYGLWKHHLQFDLLWCVKDELKPKPPYRTPSWSWGAVDGRVDQNMLKFTKGNENKFFEAKLAPHYNFGTVELNATTEGTTEILRRPYLDLECRLLPVTHKRDDGRLQVEGARGEHFIVDFSPDSLLQNPFPDLFCAEVMTVTDVPNFVDTRPRTIYGIVLQVADCGASSGERPIYYERVGMFWMSPKTAGPRDQFRWFWGCKWKTIRII